MKIERAPTGIKGFDELIEGGLPRNTLILITGPCGTGKTIFGMNFLVGGAKLNEPGIFISLEEKQKPSFEAMKQFGWDLEELEKKNMLIVSEPELYDYDKLLTHIEDLAAKINAKRVVIDSGSFIGNFFKDKFKIRKAMIDLQKVLERINCTGLLINEISEGSSLLSSYGVEEFVADGVIVLHMLKHSDSYHRAIAIRKLFATNHSLKIHPMRIVANKGIVVYPNAKLFDSMP
ncbi:MAG: circadian clock protein KaiC [Candidatus Iainarchaeum archaeon]|uniref:Circadian clock protein KaiC n=1 Tax=Candidatus Iainarchaeum sp. TaxID=3101447 RepID=A0A497JIU0_9ARCH|nr:MAG: circadian clock protein KaiC [Candidatus Diapherotrites archaeon]